MAVCLKGICPLDPKTGLKTGHVLLYGSVLTALLNFLIIAAVIYFFVVKPVQRLMDRFKTQPEPSDPVRDCPECLSKVPAGAVRCAFCTVELTPV
jgi:large conductance mechanosensitive channel